MVCLGAYGTHWVPSLALDELCVMLWDMARYQNYDIRSPYNREAAQWAANQDDVPVPDGRPIRSETPGPRSGPGRESLTLELRICPKGSPGSPPMGSRSASSTWRSTWGEAGP